MLSLRSNVDHEKKKRKKRMCPKKKKNVINTCIVGLVRIMELLWRLVKSFGAILYLFSDSWCSALMCSSC